MGKFTKEKRVHKDKSYSRNVRNFHIPPLIQIFFLGYILQKGKGRLFSSKKCL
jgi:hypothetical protein